MPTPHLPLRMTELLAGALAATLGWVGILLTLLGPSQAAVSAAIDADASTVAQAPSLLAAGVSPATLAALLLAGIGLVVVLAGAWIHAMRNIPNGRWLIAIGAVPVVLAAIATPLGTLLIPGAGLAIATAAFAWTAPRWVAARR